MACEIEQAPRTLKPAFELGFSEPYLIGQVSRSGENWPPESDFRRFAGRAGQLVQPGNLRKPATQRDCRFRGERDAQGNWRRRCDRLQTVSGLKPWR